MRRRTRAVATAAAIIAAVVAAEPATADPLPPWVATACGTVTIKGKAAAIDIWGTKAPKTTCSTATSLVRFAAGGKPPTKARPYNPRTTRVGGVKWTCNDYGTKIRGTGQPINYNPWRYICDSRQGSVGGGRVLAASKYKLRAGG